MKPLVTYRHQVLTSDGGGFGRDRQPQRLAVRNVTHSVRSQNSVPDRDNIFRSSYQPTGRSCADIVNGLVMREGTLLLARRGPRRVAYPGLWSFPGGHVEEGETLDEALVRELREEIGIHPMQYSLLRSFRDPNSGADDPVCYHMYAVTSWSGGQPTLCGDEHSELAWFAPWVAMALPDLALEEYRLLIAELFRQ